MFWLIKHLWFVETELPFEERFYLWQHVDDTQCRELQGHLGEGITARVPS